MRGRTPVGAVAPVVLVALVALLSSGCGGTDDPPAGEPPNGSDFKVGMLPKTTADPFFVAAQQGAEEAAKELGLELIYNGPSTLDVAGQNQIISQWTQRRLNAITVSANDPDALAPSLEQAASAGIKVSAWNADVAPDAREWYMGNPTPEALAEALVEEMVSSVGAKAKILVMTSTLTAPNQNSWLKAIEAYVASKYPDFVIQKILPGEADTSKSFNVARAWLQAHPETQGILTVDGSELAGAAQAVNALGKKGEITLTGIGVPSQSGKDIESGTVKSAILWNPVDQGYATMHMVKAQLDGTLKRGATSLKAGRLGELPISGDTIQLAEPLIFTKENIDEFEF